MAFLGLDLGVDGRVLALVALDDVLDVDADVGDHRQPLDDLPQQLGDVGRDPVGVDRLVPQRLRAVDPVGGVDRPLPGGPRLLVQVGPRADVMAVEDLPGVGGVVLAQVAGGRERDQPGRERGAALPGRRPGRPGQQAEAGPDHEQDRERVRAAQDPGHDRHHHQGPGRGRELPGGGQRPRRRGRGRRRVHEAHQLGRGEHAVVGPAPAFELLSGGRRDLRVDHDRGRVERIASARRCAAAGGEVAVERGHVTRAGRRFLTTAKAGVVAGHVPNITPIARTGCFVGSRDAVPQGGCPKNTPGTP